MAYNRERYARRPVPPGPVTEQYLLAELANVQRGIPWPAAIDARDFGVEAGKGDQTSRIQKALDALGSDGGEVYLPFGRHRIDSTLQYKSDRTILRGAGQATILDYRGSGTAIDFNGKQFCGAQDFQLVSTTGAIGLDIGDIAHYFAIRRVIVSGEDAGDVAGWTTAAFQVERSYYGKFEHCEANYATRGFYGIRECNGNTWTGCHARQCYRGYHITDTTSNSEGNHISGGNVESNQADTVSGIEVTGADSNVFTGVRLELNFGTHIIVQAGAGVAQYNEFTNCSINGVADAIILGGTGSDGAASVLGTAIRGGRAATDVVINDDCTYTVLEAAPSAYGGSLTDDGYGSIVHLDPSSGLWYERNGSSRTVNGYQRTVGGALSIWDFNDNGARLDYTDFSDAFEFEVVDAGGTALPVMRFGAYRVWVNQSNGKMYINGATPTSVTDGTIVGTQS